MTHQIQLQVCAVAAGALLIAGMAEASGFKTRGIWVDPPSFATAAAADEMVSRCQRAGLNLILPNVMCYQTIAFKSSHFKGRVAATDQFDPLGYLSRKCRAAGIKLQPWCCVYYEGARGAVAAPINPSWSVRSIAGKPFDKNFISPANPEVNPYLLAVLKDLLAYDIDGIHLDYIRYPGGAFDYSDAARRAFETDRGFDPQDFLDHPERIVPPESEEFPVRVLWPASHVDRVWETTAIERTLDQAGLGFAYVSESPENLTALRVPGLLLVSSYGEVPACMVEALERYVARGGNLLWTEPPGGAVGKMPRLQKLLGLASTRWLGAQRVKLQPAGDDPLALTLPATSFRTDSTSLLAEQGAKVVARFDTGEPAVLLNEVGKGRAITLSFHLMKSTSPEVAAIARQIVGWCQIKAGVSTLNPLAVKRAEWAAWRGERVTQLVRDLKAAAKASRPELLISSSGGPSPFEFYACYRDARRWLAEGLNDEAFPMNYTENPEVLSEMLELQTASAPPGTFRRIFPGLQLYATRTVKGVKQVSPQSPAVVTQQLQIVKQQGCDGFCLFAYNHLSDELITVVQQFSPPAP